VGGARGVHMQTIRGGAALCAAVFKVIAVFCREENKDREKVILLFIFCTKGYRRYFVNPCVLEELYFDTLSF
jgi:predicted CoA-binding protein